MAQRRTDLAREAHQMRLEEAGGTPLPGVEAEERTVQGFPVHRVSVTDERGEKALGRPRGQYLTLELDGLLRREEDSFGRAVRAVAELLEPLIPQEGPVLAVGLGSRTVTPDTVGPMAADRMLATRHLTEQLPEHFGSLRQVAVLVPGVLAATGVESARLVAAAVRELQPVCVVAVDALASRSAERLCRTVQITDTGISPGSGVGNHRLSLDRETLGVPVAAVGVPTVVEASTLILDLLGLEEGAEVPGGELFVTPREVDSSVADLSRVIGWGVTMALNPSLTAEDLALLLE